MKPQNPLLVIGTFLLSTWAITAHAQKDSNKAFLLSHNEQLVIGVYAGHNLSFPLPKSLYFGFPSSEITSRPMAGDIYQVSLKYKLPRKLFLSTGITYETQNFAINNNEGYDAPLISPTPVSGSSFNNDFYVYTISTSNIEVPLNVGYFSTQNKLTYYASFGIDFFYSYKTNIQLYDGTKGINVDNETFYPYHIYRGWTWGFNGPNLTPLNAFGLLSFGQSYLIMPKISISYEACLRFHNPLNSSTFQSISAASLSLNLGLNYSIDLDNTGSFLLPDKEKDGKKHQAGFKITPNYVAFARGIPTDGISFSYDFSMQFNITSRVALETGIVVDNFNNINSLSLVSMGVPLIAKYYFPKENGPSYFIGAGVHIDWPNDFDWGGNWDWTQNEFDWIRPVGVIENGWDFKLGNNYILNTAFGLENWFKPIKLSNITLGSFNSPITVFGSIGMSYSF